MLNSFKPGKVSFTRTTCWLGIGLVLVSLVSEVPSSQNSASAQSAAKEPSAQAAFFGYLQRLDCSRAILSILPLFAHDTKQPLKEPNAKRALARDLNFIGRAFQLDENEIAAVQVLSIAHQLDPTNVSVTAHLLDNLSRTGRIEEADRLANVVSPQAAQNATVAQALALHEIRKNNIPAARTILETLPQNNRLPGIEGAIVLRARTLLKLGFAKNVAQLFRQAAKLTSSEYNRQLWLASAEIIEGKNDARIEHTRRAGTALPNDPVWHTELGIALGHSKPDEAFAEHDKALQCPRLTSRAFYTMAAFLNGQSRSEEAIACVKYLLRLRPRSSEANFQLAKCGRKAKQSKEAIAAYMRVLELNPFTAPARIDLAEIYSGLHQDDLALAQLKLAVKYSPNSLEVWKSLGTYYRRHNQNDKALAAFQSALSLTPKPRI